MRLWLLWLVLPGLLFGCGRRKATSDEVQQRQQERLLMEGTGAVGMPSITNFRERKLLKDILEMRDHDGLATYTYLFSPQLACLLLLGPSIGYGIPYATQFTSPQKIADACRHKSSYCPMVVPQADPNGLFSPATAEGTWVMMLDPETKKAKAVLVEPRTITTPFRLRAVECRGQGQ